MSISKQEKQRLNQVKDTLIQALLNRGECVDDVLSTIEGDGGNKPREKLLTAFYRKHQQHEGGFVEFAGVSFAYSDLEWVFKGMDFAPKSHHLSLAKTISLADIQGALKLAGMPAWRDTTDEVKLDILWGMGLAVKFTAHDADEDASRYYTERKMHRNITNKTVYDLCITANERTDDEWKKSPHCSYEAKIFTKDIELAKELQEMSRSY